MRSIKGLTIAGISFCPRKIVVTATKDSILLMLGGFLKNTAKNTNQQPHYANVVQQADKRGNENNRREYAKGEDKARTVKQNIHFGTDQRTKIKALPASPWDITLWTPNAACSTAHFPGENRA